jgi:hypothetical protein
MNSKRRYGKRRPPMKSIHRGAKRMADQATERAFVIFERLVNFV